MTEQAAKEHKRREMRKQLLSEARLMEQQPVTYGQDVGQDFARAFVLLAKLVQYLVDEDE